MPAGRPRINQQMAKLSGLDKHSPQKFSGYNLDESGVPIVSLPKCPYKNKKVKDAWIYVSSFLCGLGCLSEQDLPLFYAFMDSYNEYVLLEDKLKTFDKEVFDITDPKSIQARQALVSMKDKAYQNFEKGCRLYGCTPCDRTKLPVNKKGEVNLIDAMIGEDE